jgi:hypothetical protein
VRTTLSIDDDVLHAVRERAVREHRTAGDVLSELARQALIGQHRAPTVQNAPDSHGFRPLPARGPIVSRALIEQLREDELA